jgi:DNA-binding CsgD family transcriptional regulator
MQTVSRQAEREAIVELLRSVEQQGAPAVLELVGEAGIGKTTLLETVEESPRGGRLVLRGRAAEFEGDLPYGLFIDALDAYLAGISERPSGGLDPGDLAELAGVFPALERRVAAPVVLVREERFRFHRAVRALLEQVAGRGSAVLALDDVHFADPSSCELLASLLRRPPDGPVLLAVAYRSGRGPPAVTSELIAAARSGRVERIELGPLSRTDSEALMAAEGLSAAARERLFALSGGNPFFLDRLVRANRRADAGSDPPELAPTTVGESVAAVVPAEVAVVLAQEVGALPATARAVVQGAAVAGEPFEPDLVAEIAGVGESEVLLALDELQDHDLIRPTAVAREFRFRHPLVRAAVYRSLKGGWRVAAHARAAAALARRGAAAMLVAPHLEQSARAGDRDAIGVLAEAGRAAAGRAPANAARWFAAAVRLAPTHGAGSEQRLELMPELAGALASVGALERCHEVVVEALAMLPETIDERRTALIAGCAQAEIFLGRYDQARARLVKALDSVGEELTPVRVGLQLALASCASYANELDLAVLSARRALDGARQLARPRLHAGALSILSLSAYAAGNLDDAEAAHKDGSALVGALEDTTIERHVELLWFLGWAGWFLGHYTAAESHFGRGIAISRTSDARLLTEMTVGRAITLTWLGRLDEAVASSQDALEAAQLNNNPSRLMWCNIARCLSLTAVGELEAAAEAGENAVGIARQLGTSVISAAAGWAWAAALIEAGQPSRAVEVMLEMLGGPDLTYYYAGMRPLCYGLLTRAEIQRGSDAGACDWAARATASAEQVGSALGWAHADLARAVASLADEPAVASELALGSAEAFDRTGGVVDAARARLLTGRALAAVRDRERAGDELRRAEESFAHFGATRLRAEAVRELRRIGRRVSSTGRRGMVDGGRLASLSRREQEVADLVTARMTNREIAAQLFLSEKTVESHLSSVFVKLGVTSRTEVARVVEGARSATGTPAIARPLTPRGP